MDRYVIYDDGSTDGTLTMLAARPNGEIHRFDPLDPNSFVESSRIWQNNVWKQSRGHAGWVVLTAIDEHLFHRTMSDYLLQCRAARVTAVPALGFNMVSQTVPGKTETLADTRRMGMPTWEMNKLSLFDPSALDETNFSAGRHFAEPSGRVVYPQADEVLNLHYKFIDKDYFADRHRELRHGLGPDDLNKGLGQQYSWSNQEFEDAWRLVSKSAVDYANPSIGFATHMERWWRGKRLRECVGGCEDRNHQLSACQIVRRPTIAWYITSTTIEPTTATTIL